MSREPWFGVEWSDAFLNDVADGRTELTCPRHRPDQRRAAEAGPLMSPMDWLELVTRREDPECLAGTEVELPLGWGDEYDAFVRSLA